MTDTGSQTTHDARAHQHFCPECVETRVHPQPFIDNAGRVLCGACWFMDGEEVVMRTSNDIFSEW